MMVRKNYKNIQVTQRVQVLQLMDNLISKHSNLNKTTMTSSIAPCRQAGTTDRHSELRWRVKKRTRSRQLMIIVILLTISPTISPL